jgi:integrase
VSAQRGQIFRKPSGQWAIRWRDASGCRRQRTGFVTKGEAREVLDEELRRVRLGPLHRPRATLEELKTAYLAQYEAAPSTVSWLTYNLEVAIKRFGDQPLAQITAQQVGAWRASLPEARRHPAHRGLRQVLQAAVRWKWIEENAAAAVKNPQPCNPEIDPFESWAEIDAIRAELSTTYGALVVFLVGTGVRPEEAFGADWRDVDLRACVLTVRRAYAKGRLKQYPKTVRSRRRVPLRARVVAALDSLPKRRGILFPNANGRRVDINTFRNRSWTPSLTAAGVEHRRIYDLRHTYATWSLAAGVDIYTLARRMGTSLQMIDRTYGHLAPGADDYERQLLDAFDAGDTVGRAVDAQESEDAP